METELLTFIQDALPYAIVGFAAQMIDGALGMAYGVTSTSLLLSSGISAAAASASVHTAEVFTTGVSGLSHWKLGNVDKALFKKLIIPGVLGGILGAYILSNVPGKIIKPFVAIYLCWMGMLIFYRALRNKPRSPSHTPLTRLGLAGGFFDAIGGGGWGPIVTSTLVANGNNPRYTIGSVNMSEFFVTFAEAATFYATIGLVHVHVIVGLILGGVLAAPLGALVCRKIPPRIMMFIVGLLIMALSIRTIVLSFI
ncbi:MAG: sulfite exporter TauE/SafE family protein [Anaerolineales bacterium]|nr:sulfite exporter TauE/SafE family protein [Anaerolineales bacterium]